jgi:hypothetical protein
MSSPEYNTRVRREISRRQALVRPELLALEVENRLVRRGQEFYSYVCFYAWRRCPQCHVLYWSSPSSKDLSVPRVRARPRPTATCAQCRTTPYFCPRASDFPEVLTRLPVEDARLLRVAVSVYRPGPRGRHGYLSVGPVPTCFYEPTSVRARVNQAEEHIRAPLSRAFAFLMEHGDRYRREVALHEAALSRGGSRSILFSHEGLDAALWPCLFYSDVLSDLRWAEVNRRDRSRRSIARSFGAKLLSAEVSAYRDNSSLAHFVFLQWAVRLLTACHHVAERRHITWKEATEDRPLCPSYWLAQLNVLQDVCQVYGAPQLFLTMSVDDNFFGFPMPDWLDAEVTRDGRQYRDSGFIAGVHTARTLIAAFKTLVLGEGPGFRADEAMLSEDGASKVTFWFYRLQAQARGSLHLHALLFGDGVRQSAERLIVNGETRVRLESEAYCALFDRVQRDGTQRPRSCFVHVLAGTRSNSDCTFGDGDRLSLATYVCAYACRPEGAPQDVAYTAQDAAARQLASREIHEPEAAVLMTAGIPMSQFKSRTRYARAFLSQGGFRGVRTKGAGVATYEAYCGRPEAALALPLLEYLRASPSGPVPVGWYKHSRCSDWYVGDLLAFLVPHRSWHEFSSADPDGVLDADVYFTALALARPDVDLRELLRTSLCEQGCAGEFVSTALRALDSRAALVEHRYVRTRDRYLASTRPARTSPPRANLASDFSNLDPGQYLVVLRVLASILRRAPSTAADVLPPEVTAAVATVASQETDFFIGGGPGTGKTHVLALLARVATALQLEPVVVAPTGLRASQLRALGLDADTFHATTRYGRTFAPLPDFSSSHVVFVDEAGMLDGPMLRHLVRVTRLTAFSRAPLLVLVGDLEQLHPVGGPPGLLETGHARRFRRLDLCVQHRVQLNDDHLVTVAAALRGGCLSTTSLASLGFTSLASDEFSALDALRSLGRASVGRGRPFPLVLTASVAASASANLVLSALYAVGREHDELVGWAGGSAAPCNLKVAVGAPLMVTVNQAKSLGAVNGAQGAYVKRVRAVLLMQLACGRAVPVHLTRHPRTGELVYPVVLAFACTVHKVQGATVCQDLVIWPDLNHEVIARNFPGWLYVAVTRAQRWEQLSFLTPVTSALTHRAHTGKRRI